MKNKFISDIRQMYSENYAGYTQKAYERIYENLFLKNNWGSEKLTDVDEYDSETKSLRQLLPGYVYMFNYRADKNPVYTYNNVKFEYYDNIPIILCLKDKGNVIQGFNLNLCNLGLRTLILNDIYNLDTDFFDKDAELQSVNGNFPMSKGIISFLQSESNVNKYCEYVVKNYNLQNPGLIYRSYKKSNISNIRFIEPWQWKYIPFLTYKHAMKDNILSLIQQITNIDKIKI